MAAGNFTVPWPEYPRPALRRAGNFTILNGRWDYAVSPTTVLEPPTTYQGSILVPFPIEAPLSGVARSFSPRDVLWYRRWIGARPSSSQGSRRVLLNFEAVDYNATVWVNRIRVGSHDGGGSLPFSFDITDALDAQGPNELVVRVIDATDEGYQLHGKQLLEFRGRKIWYTPSSGIWQTVWMEEVEKVHVTRVHCTPTMDGAVSIRLGIAGNGASDTSLVAHIIAFLKGKPVARALPGLDPRRTGFSPSTVTCLAAILTLGSLLRLSPALPLC